MVGSLDIADVARSIGLTRSGVGVVAITLIGWVMFRKQLALGQLGCIALIAIGAVGLNLTSHTMPDQRVGTGSVPE